MEPSTKSGSVSRFYKGFLIHNTCHLAWIGVLRSECPTSRIWSVDSNLDSDSFLFIALWFFLRPGFKSVLPMTGWPQGRPYLSGPQSPIHKIREWLDPSHKLADQKVNLVHGCIRPTAFQNIKKWGMSVFSLKSEDPGNSEPLSLQQQLPGADGAGIVRAKPLLAITCRAPIKFIFWDPYHCFKSFPSLTFHSSIWPFTHLMNFHWTLPIWTTLDTEDPKMNKTEFLLSVCRR